MWGEYITDKISLSSEIKIVLLLPSADAPFCRKVDLPPAVMQMSIIDTREDDAEYAANFGFNVVDTVVN